MNTTSDDHLVGLPSPASPRSTRSVTVLRATALYEVVRCTHGREVAARFRLLDDALRYVSRNRSEGPYEVCNPDGDVIVKLGRPPTPRSSRPTRPCMPATLPDETD